MSSKVRSNKRGIRKVDEDQLTVNQQRFVDEWAADSGFNSTEAARRVGYKNPAVSAAKMMKNPLIAKALGKAIHEMHKKAGVKAERVMEELVRIAYFNPQGIVKDDGSPMNLKDIPPEIACCIESMDVQVREYEGEITTSYRFRWYNKIQALDMLCKHLGFYVAQKADVEIDLKGLLPALIERVSQRNNVLDTSAIQRAINGPTGAVGAHNPTIIEVPSE